MLLEIFFQVQYRALVLYTPFLDKYNITSASILCILCCTSSCMSSSIPKRAVCETLWISFNFNRNMAETFFCNTGSSLFTSSPSLVHRIWSIPKSSSCIFSSVWEWSVEFCNMLTIGLWSSACVYDTNVFLKEGNFLYLLGQPLIPHTTLKKKFQQNCSKSSLSFHMWHEQCNACHMWNKRCRKVCGLLDSDRAYLEKQFIKNFSFDSNVLVSIGFQRYDPDWEEYILSWMQIQFSVIKKKFKVVVIPRLVFPPFSVHVDIR